MCGLLHAQLKVNSSGDVSVNGDPYSTYHFSVYGSSYTSGNLRVNSNIYNYGNLYTKKIFSGYGGFGGYMQMDGDPNSNQVGYAVKISGGAESQALYVAGDSWINGTSFYSSDKRLKNEIADNKQQFNSILDRIANIESKEYHFKSRKELLAMHKSGEVFFSTDTISMYDKAYDLLKKEAANNKELTVQLTSCSDDELKELINKKYLKRAKWRYDIIEELEDDKYVVAEIPNYDTTRINYGFYAQDIEPVFPDLVKMDSVSGMYSVNYMGFVPINFQAIKELKQENEELRAELETIKSYLGINAQEEVKSKSAKKASSSLSDIEDVATISQNSPNPFSESTRIDCYLPESTKSATVYIYDMNGKQLKSYPLAGVGHCSLTITGGELYAGIFTYALVTDSGLVDSKRMVLTE